MKRGTRKGCVLAGSVLVFAALAVAPRRSAGASGTGLPALGGGAPTPPTPSVSTSTTLGDLLNLVPAQGSSGSDASASSGTATSPTLPKGLVNYTVNENVSDSGNTGVDAKAGCCG